MASMLSVHQKMYRARDHYIELREALVRYYESKPVEFVESSDSTPDKPSILLREKAELPKRFGLMFGDCIQCQRSCLDYLVHELIRQNGKPHHTQNQFPVSLSTSKYKDKIRSHYLDGVSSSAAAVIEILQPYHSASLEKHPLAILDKIANINKHRRVILTNFVSTNMHPVDQLQFPHIRATGRAYSLSTGESFEAPVWGYVTIKDEPLQDEEIISTYREAFRVSDSECLPFIRDILLTLNDWRPIGDFPSSASRRLVVPSRPPLSGK